jgi:hypothetical protein
MKKIDIQKIFEVLSTALRCPVCDYKYNLERTKIIETKQEQAGNLSLLIHSNCEKCKSNVVFSVSISGPEIFSVGMVTDLTDADTTKFSKKEAITSEQILGLHHFLEDFNGDFAKILAK